MQQSHGLARLLTHAIIHHPPKLAHAAAQFLCDSWASCYQCYCKKIFSVRTSIWLKFCPQDAALQRSRPNCLSSKLSWRALRSGYNVIQAIEYCYCTVFSYRYHLWHQAPINVVPILRTGLQLVVNCCWVGWWLWQRHAANTARVYFRSRCPKLWITQSACTACQRLSARLKCSINDAVKMHCRTGVKTCTGLHWRNTSALQSQRRYEMRNIAS